MKTQKKKIAPRDRVKACGYDLFIVLLATVLGLVEIAFDGVTSIAFSLSLPRLIAEQGFCYAFPDRYYGIPSDEIEGFGASVFVYAVLIAAAILCAYIVCLVLALRQTSEKEGRSLKRAFVPLTVLLAMYALDFVALIAYGIYCGAYGLTLILDVVVHLYVGYALFAGCRACRQSDTGDAGRDGSNETIS